MSLKTTRVASATLFLGAAAITGAGPMSSAPAYAAPATETENKALVDTINGMKADAAAGRFADALAKAKVADTMTPKPADLTRNIHLLIVSYAISAKDYNAALAQIDKMIGSNEGNKNENLKQALGIAISMKNNAKIQEYSGQLGNSLDNETRLYIASQMANAGQLKEALAYAAPVLQGGNPSEAALQFQQAIYFKMNDANGRRAALEQLVTNYPKPQYWHDLLQLARNEKGLNDEQAMDIYRLRFALGDLKTDADFQEMAQEALVAGYPAEAKAVLDKATAAKLLNGERSVRLVKMTGDRVAADAGIQADLQKKAAADPNSSVKLGLIYWSFGKHKEAEEAIRAGIMGGKLADPDQAKMALGHALLGQGKKQEAVSAFDSVARNSKIAPIAKLWSIYARKG